MSVCTTGKYLLLPPWLYQTQTTGGGSWWKSLKPLLTNPTSLFLPSQSPVCAKDVLLCASQETFQWLQAAVCAEVFISGPPPEIPRFVQLLQGQNPRLHTGRWILRHQPKTDESLPTVWSIDHESHAAADDKPYYGLGRVVFKVSCGVDPGRRI